MKKPDAKLELQRETVRKLVPVTPSELAAVAGGRPYTRPVRLTTGR